MDFAGIQVASMGLGIFKSFLQRFLGVPGACNRVSVGFRRGQEGNGVFRWISGGFEGLHEGLESVETHVPPYKYY